jgi:hypothetical protein
MAIIKDVDFYPFPHQRKSYEYGVRPMSSDYKVDSCALELGEKCK